MNMDFADAMRAAMNLTRDQKLVEATRVIQSALSGGEPVPSESPSEAAPISLAIETHVIDLTAEVIEPEMMASAELDADPRSEQSQPSRIAAWAAGPLGEALATLRHTELPRFSLKAAQGARDPGRGAIPEPVLCLRGREPKLQALYSASSSDRQTRLARHAAWRHAGCRRLRGRYPHECSRRGAWIYRRLSEPVQSRKRIFVLELVYPREPNARAR